MSDIAFHGQLDAATYGDAVRRTKSMRRMTVLLGVLLVIGIAGMIETYLRGEDVRTFLPLVIMSSLLLFGLLSAARTGARRQIAGNKSLQGPIRGVAREDGISIVSDYTTSDFPWDALHRHELVPDAILLYTSPGVATILPRFFFGSDADWEAMRARVAEKVPASVKGAGKSPLRIIVLWILIIIGVFLYRAIFSH